MAEYHIDEIDIANMLRHMFLIGMNHGRMTNQTEGEWIADREEAIKEMFEDYERTWCCSYNEYPCSIKSHNCATTMEDY